jgi:hypothetical protein
MYEVPAAKLLSRVDVEGGIILTPFLRHVERRSMLLTPRCRKSP